MVLFPFTCAIIYGKRVNIQQMFIEDRMDYRIELIRNCEKEAVVRYWDSLLQADTLKYRLSDMDDPSVEDAVAMSELHHMASFFVLRGDKPVAEFMFEGFTGDAARVHFCMSPENGSKLNYELATTVTNEVLNKWKKRGTEEPYLKTIYGITPTKNRVASIFIQRCGFKKKATVPDFLDYMGGVSDALLTVKTRSK